MEIPSLQGKMRKRTAEGIILFCEKPGCKVRSKLGIIWDTYAPPFYFGVSSLLRELVYFKRTTMLNGCFALCTIQHCTNQWHVYD